MPPAYSFEALDAQGQTRKGVIEADSPKSARGQLRAQALVPLFLQPINEARSPGSLAQKPFWQRPLKPNKPFSQAALTVWTRQLAGLLGAGLPLERTLTALMDEALNEAQHGVVATLRTEVKGGMSFAQALRTQAPVFSPTYIAVVEAGEKSGQLSGVLDRLANDLEERQALSAKVWGAALYPLIVSLIAVVIVTFLVTYVVPQVANVFAHSKRGLPTLTVVMLAISGFMRHQGWLLLVAIIGGGVGFSWALRQPAFATRFDARWLRLPLIGRLAQGYNAARFAGTLSMLTAAGVPILQALQAAAQTLTNRALQAAAQDILVDVREGAALSSALSRQKRFPTLLTMFARLGEQTGQLPEMLNRVAQQLSGEVQRKSMQLATILEPLLIVVMGLMVMLIVLAVLLPIIQLNQLAR